MKGSPGTAAASNSHHAIAAADSTGCHGVNSASKDHHHGSTSKIATAEQIRQAKLSQLPNQDDRRFQTIIAEVSEVTGKSPDMVSVALHDSNYEANTAIQNLLDGMYDSVELEWQTTSTKKKRIGNALADEQAPEALDEFDIKPANRGGKGPRTGRQGRGGKKATVDGENGGFNDHTGEPFHGRGRGRGRGGGLRGDSSGGRRGVSRGRGGPTRARGRSSRGGARGGRGRFGGNDRGSSNVTTSAADQFSDDDTWDTEEIDNRPAVVASPAATSGWGDDTENVATNNSTSWSQAVENSTTNGTRNWGDDPLECPDETNVTALSSASVTTTTSSLPDYAMPREENSKPAAFESNQFPSASEDVDTRPFDVTAFAESQEIRKPLSDSQTESQPMISGVHESYLLEADLRPSKPKGQKTKKSKPRLNEPVQMPQGLYDDVGELNHQLGGLEFGGGSLSPVLPKHDLSASVGQQSSLPVSNSPPSTTLESYRHSVASDPGLPYSGGHIPGDPSGITNDKPKTPPGLGSLHDKQSSHRFQASPRHMHQLGKASNAIPFPKQDKAVAPPGHVSVSSTVGASAYKSSISSDRSPPDAVGGSLSNDINQSALHHINISDSSSMPAQYAASSLVSPGSSSVSRSAPGVPSLQPSGPLPDATLPIVPAFTSHTSSFNSSTSSKQFQSSGNKHGQMSGVLPMNMYPGVQQGMMPAYHQHHAMASAIAYDDMLVRGIPGIHHPVSPYYDMAYGHQNPSQTSSSTRSEGAFSGDGKFVRDTVPAPAVSSINQVNQHAAPHHVQQAAYMNANAHLPPYQYYYPPGVMPSGFPVFTTAPVYQVGAGKGHAVGAPYQSGYSSQHGSHSYNAGAQDYSLKGSPYTSSVTSSHAGKSTQSAGGVGGHSTSSDANLSGYKAGFGQDMKNYMTASPAPDLGGITMPPTIRMANYPPAQYMIHQPSMMHPGGGVANHGGHPSLDSASQGMQHASSSRVQSHHASSGMASQQQKQRDSKSYWSGSS